MRLAHSYNRMNESRVKEAYSHQELKSYFDSALTAKRGWKTDGTGTYTKKRGSIRLDSGVIRIVDPNGVQADIDYNDIFDFDVDDIGSKTSVLLRLGDSNIWWYF